MNFNKFINSDYLKSNPLCGIDTYKDELNLATGGCTRKIKKYEFAGTESLQTSGSGNTRFFYLSIADARSWAAIIGDRYVNANISSTTEDIGIAMSGNSQFRIRPDTTSTVEQYKQYLAAQYAAGTPVTIWYVLATPTTETITVPSGLSGTEEGFLIQDGTPTPTNPIYPTANTVEKWFDINHYIMRTDTDTITTLPAVIYANDTTAMVGLKGNMEQSGTPSPSSPITPSETGDKTANLINYVFCYHDTITFNEYFDYYLLQLEPNTTYTAVSNCPSGTNTWSGKFETTFIIVPNEVVFSTDNGGLTMNVARTITTQESGIVKVGIRTKISTSGSTITFVSESDFDDGTYYIMMNKGSTALPYEPYGVKIPILNNSQTTNVYLGEVESTRKVKKLVLTGEESNWDTYTVQDGSYCAFLPLQNFKGAETTAIPALLICTHYNTRAQNTIYNGTYKVCCGGRTTQGLLFRDENITSETDFKAYLQQQYAAGTPVTVWYVLATPQTAVVNEPIRKIGTYADEVSGITIPTIAGANTLSIGTTLQPSEVTVNYKGWHSVADVHEYPDSSWMPTSWEEFRKAVRSGKAQSLYPVGTKLYENWGDTTSDAWIIVDYPTGEDYLDSDLAQQGYTNRVMLMEEKLNYLRQFDAIEAWLYVETAIPAGTYRFTIPNYDASYGGNKTYIFTSTANVPVGGQLTLTWAYQQNPSAVQAYSSATSTSALFNVSITEWDGTTACTDLGTIKLAQNDADSAYGKLNHIHRARYGSNNYYQSGYRQWLNTNASANWWTPTNVFDRPYGNRTNAGRLNVMNSNMKSVLATPTVNCITNNLFEYPSLDGTTFSLQTAYTVKDKLFPVTHSEVNLSSSPNVNSVLDYYVGKGNADRIKYRKDNGNAYYWWLRTPYPTVAYFVRFVYTSGALYYYYASSTVGSAAACIIQ